jgi:hypothetical protein
MYQKATALALIFLGASLANAEHLVADIEARGKCNVCVSPGPNAVSPPAGISANIVCAIVGRNQIAAVSDTWWGYCQAGCNDKGNKCHAVLYAPLNGGQCTC